MIIDKTILKALKKAVKESGNTYKFSLKLEGIRQTTVRNWLLGKSPSISDKNWAKIKPLIDKYLPDEDEAPLDLSNYDDVEEGVTLLGTKRPPHGIPLKWLLFKKIELLDDREKCFILEHINEILKGKGIDVEEYEI